MGHWLLAGLTLTLSLGRPAPAPAQGRFADVPPDHWAYNAVNELAARGILVGYPAPSRAGKPTEQPQAARQTPARSRARNGTGRQRRSVQNRSIRDRKP
jgi:hypothetical protein